MPSNLLLKRDYTGLQGNNWFSICRACHAEIKECCIDVELALFPDETDQFQECDPEHFHEYKDGTFGYEKPGPCIFLTEDKRCFLHLQGIQKPVDCLIYPLNYKNGKIFLDSSCWAKDLLNHEEAILYLETKLKKYPHYKSVQYDVRESDSFVMDIMVE